MSIGIYSVELVEHCGNLLISSRFIVNNYKINSIILINSKLISLSYLYSTSYLSPRQK